jgi:hypothetical protein
LEKAGKPISNPAAASWQYNCDNNNRLSAFTIKQIQKHQEFQEGVGSTWLARWG